MGWATVSWKAKGNLFDIRTEMLCDYQSNPVCSWGNLDVMEKREKQMHREWKKNKRKKVIENNWSLHLKIIKRRKESFYNGSTEITFKEK